MSLAYYGDLLNPIPFKFHVEKALRLINYIESEMYRKQETK